MSTLKRVIHLLPNAHLDPVWLWDWREGLNEGISTVRTVLNLMREFPYLTFMRGESAIYQHIQKYEPDLFKEILKRIEEGRWDVVGGTVIQPDTNLTSTEVLCREFEIGLNFFENNMGVRPRVAWLADSFGHSAGFPHILSAFGMTGFSFTRPARGQFPMKSPAFRWEDDHGKEVLCYRQHWSWYGVERGNVAEGLDQTLAEANEGELRHVALQFGLGNHGGGPTRRHLLDIKKWEEDHPETELRFSTLHGFFEELRQEISSKPEVVPTVRGEFGFCLRGCYSSVQKFKSLFRAAESAVSTAEITRSVIGATLGIQMPDLGAAWYALSFNAFHDILPGSSIERAYDDQSAWVGLAIHQAEEARFEALNRLAGLVNTSVPKPREDFPADVPFVIWNPLPRPFRGLVELEASMDYRPLWKYVNKADEVPLVAFGSDQRPLPFQEIATEHSFMQNLPWRKRILIPVEIPPLGWTTVRMGWRDEVETSPSKGCCLGKRGTSPQIGNDKWTVEVKEGQVQIRNGSRNFFMGRRNLELRVVDDPWGSWGGMGEEEDSFCLEKIRARWTLEDAEVLETGPLRASLWTRWKGGNSWVDLTFRLEDESPFLKVEGRLLWNEKSARLQLVFPCRGVTCYDVPGGRVQRDERGQVPGGRWVTRSSTKAVMGLATDVLSDFAATSDELRVTLARASRYATDISLSAEKARWQPIVDCGELKFEFCLFDDPLLCDQAAEELLCRPTAVIAPATKGPWKSRGCLGEVSPASVRLLTFEHLATGQVRIRLQNRGSRVAKVSLRFGTSKIEVGKLAPEEIKTLILSGSEGETKNANVKWSQ